MPTEERDFFCCLTSVKIVCCLRYGPVMTKSVFMRFSFLLLASAFTLASAKSSPYTKAEKERQKAVQSNNEDEKIEHLASAELLEIQTAISLLTKAQESIDQGDSDTGSARFSEAAEHVEAASIDTQAQAKEEKVPDHQTLLRSRQEHQLAQMFEHAANKQRKKIAIDKEDDIPPEPDSRERAQPDVEDLPDGLGNVRPKAKDEEETEETDDVVKVDEDTAKAIIDKIMSKGGVAPKKLPEAKQKKSIEEEGKQKKPIEEGKQKKSIEEEWKKLLGGSGDDGESGTAKKDSVHKHWTRRFYEKQGILIPV